MITDGSSSSREATLLDRESDVDSIILVTFVHLFKFIVVIRLSVLITNAELPPQVRTWTVEFVSLVGDRWRTLAWT